MNAAISALVLRAFRPISDPQHADRFAREMDPTLLVSADVTNNHPLR